MRILFVLTYLYNRGGDSRHALSVAEGLEQAGHEVRFFGMEDPANSPDQPGPLAPHVDYRRLLASRGPGRLAALRAVYSPASGRAAAAFIERHGPFEIAHVHSVHHQLGMSVLDALDHAGIPFVWTLHDYKILCPNTSLFLDGSRKPCPAPGRGAPFCIAARRCKKGSLAASLLTAVESAFTTVGGYYERAACYLSPTAFMRDLIENAGVTTRPVEVIPNFSPIPAVEFPSPPGEDILFAGRLLEAKGAAVLLRAFARVREACRGRLVIAGEGEDGAALRSLAGELLPEGSILFTGKVEDPERMKALYLSSRCLAVPSLWVENMPLSVLEAFSCGRPVVASRIGGLPGMIGEGIRGLLAEPGSVEDLALCLSRMLTDRAGASRMGEAALESAATLYSRSAYVRRLEDLYLGVLARSTGREGVRPPGGSG